MAISHSSMFARVPGALRWLGHTLGVSPASCGTVDLCFSGSSQNKVPQRTRELSFGSLPKSGPWHLEAGPTRSAPLWVPRVIGRSPTERHHADESNRPTLSSHQHSPSRRLHLHHARSAYQHHRLHPDRSTLS